MFLIFVFLLPIIYIYFEPDRTNYLPGEAQQWQMKIKYYEGPFVEYLLRTDGGFDVFIGIVLRDYANNSIGILLLFLYCGLASGVNRVWKS